VDTGGEKGKAKGGPKNLKRKNRGRAKQSIPRADARAARQGKEKKKSIESVERNRENGYRRGISRRKA